MGLNVLSLFDGISCGRVALERAGIDIDTYYASEIDKSAIQISNNNYPDIFQVGDIKGIDESVIDKLGSIDLLIGGSPCVGFSRSGKGLNFEDPQSKLFFEYVRILNLLKEKNPNLKFLLENVVMKKEWEDLMTHYIGIEPVKINSSLVSAQKRDRLYWTNIDFEPIKDQQVILDDILEDNASDEYDLTQEQLDGKPVEIGGRVIDKFIEVNHDKATVRNGTKKGYLEAEDGDSINLAVPNSKTRRGRVGKNKSNTLDTHCNQGVFKDGRVRKFTLTEIERLQTLPDGYTTGISDSGRKKAIGNGWTVDVIVEIFKGLK